MDYKFRNTTLITLLLRPSLRECFIFLSVLFITHGAVFNATAQVTSSIDTTLIRIGEEIEYEITVEADSTALILFPEGQSFKPLEVIDSYKADTSYVQNKIRLIKKYGLTQYDSGTYKLPSQRVVINEKAFMTDSALIEVQNVVVDTTNQKMFDIKPLVKVETPPFNFLKLLYSLLLLLLFVFLGYFLLKRKKKKQEKEKQLPPYEEAMSALVKLDSSEYLVQNKSKEYYSQLTEIVKRYIHREVDNTALESTSDELIERLQAHRNAGHFDFDSVTIKNLDAIFKRADLVKFAKMPQGSGQALADRASIEGIINETKEAIPEPTEEELIENEAYLERLTKKRQQQKWIYAISGSITILTIAILVYGSVIGYTNLKDQVFGNQTREMLEGDWYKSEYGVPAIIVETPFILARKIEKDSAGNEIKDVSNKQEFSYGEPTDKISFTASTIAIGEGSETPLDLNLVLEQTLVNMENNGAINLIVKREDFNTEQGVKGLKGHGEFKIQSSKDEISKKEYGYELILLNQEKALHIMLLVFDSEDSYAIQIKDRIINSIELEIEKSSSKPQQQS